MVKSTLVQIESWFRPAFWSFPVTWWWWWWCSVTSGNQFRWRMLWINLPKSNQPGSKIGWSHFWGLNIFSQISRTEGCTIQSRLNAVSPNNTGFYRDCFPPWFAGHHSHSHAHSAAKQITAGPIGEWNTKLQKPCTVLLLGKYMDLPLICRKFC